MLVLHLPTAAKAAAAAATISRAQSAASASAATTTAAATISTATATFVTTSDCAISQRRGDRESGSPSSTSVHGRQYRRRRRQPRGEHRRAVRACRRPRGHHHRRRPTDVAPAVPAARLHPPEPPLLLGCPMRYMRLTRRRSNPPTAWWMVRERAEQGCRRWQAPAVAAS